MVHFEILAEDGEGLKSFYSEAFGWNIDSDNPMQYGMVEREEGGIPGGIGGLFEEGYPGHLTIYIESDDLDASLAQIEELGGKTVSPEMEVPGGPTIAQFTDPAGNLVGLVKTT